jgi:hypothetical protein
VKMAAHPRPHPNFPNLAQSGVFVKKCANLHPTHKSLFAEWYTREWFRSGSFEITAQCLNRNPQEAISREKGVKMTISHFLRRNSCISNPQCEPESSNLNPVLQVCVLRVS